MEFRVEHTDAKTEARAGVLSLPHGEVLTPVFMPVGTKGAVKALPMQEIEEIGFNLILANTYHLYLRPGEDLIERAGGLHGFTSYHGNFLTDSGGFQAFSLSSLCKVKEEGLEFSSCIDGSRHFFTPESVVKTQRKFNSDIQMALDLCCPYGIEKSETKEAMDITHKFALRAFSAYKEEVKKGYTGTLFPIIQGGFYEELRKESSDFISSLETPGVAIGGLSVGESFSEFSNFLNFTSRLIPPNRAKYVMGIGTPRYLLEAIEAGVDMADCVLPTRNARNGQYFSKRGVVNIKRACYKEDDKPIDPSCKCKVCARYSRRYLRHLFMQKEIAASILGSYHNLYFLNSLMQEARKAILSNRFLEFKSDILNTMEKEEER